MQNKNEVVWSKVYTHDHSTTYFFSLFRYSVAAIGAGIMVIAVFVLAEFVLPEKK